jgi:hypothetical protein
VERRDGNGYKRVAMKYKVERVLDGRYWMNGMSAALAGLGLCRDYNISLQ